MLACSLNDSASDVVAFAAEGAVSHTLLVCPEVFDVASYDGLGIAILSTPRGVLSDSEARDQNVGGEILCQVF